MKSISKPKFLAQCLVLSLWCFPFCGALRAEAANPDIPYWAILDGNGAVVGYLAGSTHHLDEPLQDQKIWQMRVTDAGFTAVEHVVHDPKFVLKDGWPWVIGEKTGELLDEYLRGDSDPGKPGVQHRKGVAGVSARDLFRYGPIELAKFIRLNSAAQAGKGGYDGLETFAKKSLNGVSPLKSLESDQELIAAYKGVPDGVFDAYVSEYLNRALGKSQSTDEVLERPEFLPILTAMRTNRSGTFAKHLLDLIAAHKSGEKPFLAIIGHEHIDELVRMLVGNNLNVVPADYKTNKLIASHQAGEEGDDSGEGSAGASKRGRGRRAESEGTPPGGPPPSGPPSGGSGEASQTGSADPDVASVLSGMTSESALDYAVNRKERQSDFFDLNPGLTKAAQAQEKSLKPMLLSEAVRTGKLTISSEGNHTTVSVRLSIANLNGAQGASLLIPAGTVFKSSSEKNQNMAAR